MDTEFCVYKFVPSSFRPRGLEKKIRNEYPASSETKTNERRTKHSTHPTESFRANYEDVA